MIIYIFIVILSVVFLYRLKKIKREAEIKKLISFYKQTKSWAHTVQPDDTIRKFIIDVPQTEIDSLNNRLDLVKWPIQSLPGTNFTYGFRDDKMKSIVKYWRNDYKWSERQELFNKFDNYKTKIEGLDLHFIHEQSQHKNAKPILITHGWPGSVVEFFKLIPLLTEGEKQKNSFHVVCASIPGYGFSDAAQKPGFNAYECARVFNTLMNRLGYEKYIVHGGDWGSMISTCIATLFPENVKGIHINMNSAQPTAKHYLKQFVGSYFPSLFYPKIESDKIFPLGKNFKNLLEETGYFHIQATKPDTVGFALSDSPVGLAAYILEKFSTWTDMDFRNTEDGSLEQHFTLDELLDNVMVYWINNNITSSMRFYKENISRSYDDINKLGSLQLKMPSGYAWLPNEIFPVSKEVITDKFTNMVQFTYSITGGHFAAFERPRLIAEELRKFSSKVAI